MKLEDPSPADTFLESLVDAAGPDAARELEAVLSECSPLELAALAHDWPTWARSKQLPPPNPWLSWGFLGARGYGKTRAICEFIHAEVQAGRVRQIGFAAQKLDRTIKVQVGSLLETAPPWFKPEWHASYNKLIWPNGAWALALTPEVPREIEGDNYDLSWICEIQSWPEATRDEAFRNFLLSTRVGLARLVWDGTPEHGHPILLRLMERAEEEPELHHVRLGLDIRENAGNLHRGAVAALEREMGGTAEGEKKLRGIMPESKEGATAKQAWIDQHRAPAPAKLARRVIAIDPATTGRSSSDETGIIEGGLLHDGRVVVLSDHTRKYQRSEWGREALRIYVAGGCDLILAETNRGGDLVVQNLRSEAILAESLLGQRLTIVVVKDDWIPQRVPGVVFVREVYSRSTKTERARPLATPYELGRLFHAKGADLSKLELEVTTWVARPGSKSGSPNRLDAATIMAVELLGLDGDAPPDASAGIAGAALIARTLRSSTPREGRRPLGALSSLLGGLPRRVI